MTYLDTLSIQVQENSLFSLKIQGCLPFLNFIFSKNTQTFCKLKILLYVCRERITGRNSDLYF